MDAATIANCQEIDLIRARGLSRFDYLRISRRAEGLPRMSRKALNCAYDAFEVSEASIASYRASRAVDAAVRRNMRDF